MRKFVQNFGVFLSFVFIGVVLYAGATHPGVGFRANPYSPLAVAIGALAVIVVSASRFLPRA